MSWLNKLKNDERGSVGIVFALTATVVFGIIGGAIDVGRAMNAKTVLQTAADAAAIDGAKVAALQSGDASAAAIALFNLNISTTALGNGTASTSANNVVPQVSVSGNTVTVSA